MTHSCTSWLCITRWYSIHQITTCQGPGSRGLAQDRSPQVKLRSRANGHDVLCLRREQHAVSDLDQCLAHSHDTKSRAWRDLEVRTRPWLSSFLRLIRKENGLPLRACTHAVYRGVLPAKCALRAGTCTRVRVRIHNPADRTSRSMD